MARHLFAYWPIRLGTYLVGPVVNTYLGCLVQNMFLVGPAVNIYLVGLVINIFLVDLVVNIYCPGS
jgi:hypothetical protein